MNMTSVTLKRWEETSNSLGILKLPTQKKAKSSNMKGKHRQENPLWLTSERGGKNIW